MKTLFTQGGKCFGYCDGNELRIHTGKHIGRFHGDEVYGNDGRYLGELINDRLITHKGKKSKRRSGFTRRINRVPKIKSIDRIGRIMISGYEDFPGPDAF